MWWLIVNYEIDIINLCLEQKGYEKIRIYEE